MKNKPMLIPSFPSSLRQILTCAAFAIRLAGHWTGAMVHPPHMSGGRAEWLSKVHAISLAELTACESTGMETVIFGQGYEVRRFQHAVSHLLRSFDFWIDRVDNPHKHTSWRVQI